MKSKLFIAIFATALLYVMPAGAASLTVSANATKVGSLYDYSYMFSLTGTGAGFNNIFLGSGDISPFNVAFQFDGASTTSWSWLGNDTPQNYLQFFSTASTLSPGDTLAVTFASALAPASTHFAIAVNSGTSAMSNEVTGVLAPTPAPEPMTCALAALGLIAAGFVRRRASK